MYVFTCKIRLVFNISGPAEGGKDQKEYALNINLIAVA